MIIVPSNVSTVAPVSYSSIGVGVEGSALSWTHNLASVRNGYLIVYVMCGGGGGNTGTVSINGIDIPQIAPYLSWSDGGGYMFTAYALRTPSTLTGTQTITMTSGLSYGETSAQSVFYANVGNVAVGSSSSGGGAWTSSVTVPQDGYASNGFGSRIPSVNLAGGELLFSIGGSARDYLAVQQSKVSTTFTANANGRGYGNVRVVMSPLS